MFFSIQIGREVLQAQSLHDLKLLLRLDSIDYMLTLTL
jgi:hypothetical protein